VTTGSPMLSWPTSRRTGEFHHDPIVARSPIAPNIVGNQAHPPQQHERAILGEGLFALCSGQGLPSMSHVV
jgi:hypothetical protein